MAGKLPIILLSILLLSFNLFAQTADEEGLCDNGIDDDKDGFVDCFDSDCNQDPTQCTDFFFGNDIVCNSVTENPTFSLRMQWGSANRTAQSSTTPAIGDIDGDGIPEVVVTNRESQELYVLDGRTGTTEGVVNVGFTVNRTAAIAKVDSTTADCGWIFIQGATSRNIKAYDCNLNQMWSVNGSHASDSPGLLSLADFDGDGNVELYHKNEIRNALTGALIVWGGGSWINESAEGSSAADILPDAFCTNCDGLELADGSKIWSVDIATGTMEVEVDMDDVLATDLEAIALGLSASERKFKHKRRGNKSHQTTYVSLADYNQDGNIDVVTSGALGDSYTDEPVTIFFWDVINQDVDFYQDSTANLSFKNGTGRINVGDTDGDGQLNATYVSNQILYSLDENLDPIWTLGIKEGSSGFTGCTLFDFDGDGAAETVYRGEDFLFIIDGATTNPAERVRNTVVCVSRTYEDYPVVADVDGDGASEICVTCSFNDNQPFHPYSNSINGHVRIFESDGEQWLPSRPVWNQHGYFNTHINDDLTIPIEQQSHTRVFNNEDCSGVSGDFQPLNVFLNQLSILDSEGCPNAVFPDLGLVDGSITITPPTCPENEFPVSFEVANEGDIPINGILPVSFYDGDPRVDSSTYLSTDFFTLTGIAAGQVVTVNTTATGTGTDFDLWVSVNDLGGVPPVTTFVGSIPECTLGANLGNGLVDVGPFMIEAIFLTDDARCLPIIPPNGSMQAFFNGTLPASESLIWLEDFEDLTPTDISDNGATAWSRITPSGNAQVLNQIGGNVFWFKNTQGEAVWTSQIINISTFDFADLSLTFFSSGNLEGSDYLRAFYSVDGGTETLFTNNGDNSGSFFTSLPTATVVGNSVQIIVRSSTNNTNEEHFIEDVQVLGGINAQTGQISSGFTFEWFLDGDFSTVVHTGDSIIDATPGVYSVVGINDGSGCQSDTLFNHVTIATAMPTAPVVSIVEVVPNTDCAIPNGLLRAAVIENGMEVTAGFDFEWTEATVTTVVISVGATADFLPGGTYAVTATSQSSGCKSNTESAIILAPAPSVTLSAQVDQHVVDCVNPLSGEVSASASGTPTPAAEEIIWLEDFEDNTDNQESDNGATAWTRSPDNNGARVDDDDYSPDTKFRFSNTDETVTWSSQVIDISGFTDVNVSITLDERGNQDDPEILEATYILDGAPEVIFGMTQNEFTNPLVVSSGNFTGTSLTILMRGFSNTTADDLYFDDVTVKGFTTVAPTFVFNWYVGQTTTALPDYNGTTVTGLAPGFYTVEAEGVLSKCVSPPITIEVLNNAGLPIIAAVPVDNNGCTTGNGEIETTVTNSIQGDTYSIEIFPGNQTATGSIVLFDNIVAGVSSIAQNHIGLLNGFYTVEVVNKTQRCRSTDLVEVAGVPSTLTVDTTPGNIQENKRTSCGGILNGSIVVNPAAVVGIPGTLTYKIWMGTSSTPSRTPFATNNKGDFQGLDAGDYTLVVENSFGCASGDILLNVPLMRDEPEITELRLAGDANCGVNPTGLIEIEIVSDNLPVTDGYYDLQLYSGSDQTMPIGLVVEIDGLIPANPDPTFIYNGLTAGVYNIVILNNDNGCDIIHPFTIADLSLTVTPVFSLANITEVQNISCGAPNGFLAVVMDDGSPSGTTAGFSFDWYEGAVVDVNPIAVNADGDNNEATQGNLSAIGSPPNGEYTVFATNLSTGCTATLVLDIIDAPINPIVTIDQDMNDSSCDPGNPTGQLTATVDGVSQYDFDWFLGTDTTPGLEIVGASGMRTSSTYSGLVGATTYTVVASAFGCSGSDSEMVVDNAVRPAISLADVTIQDNGGCTNPTGQITLNQVTFGTDPPTLISGLNAGILTIDWYDGNMVQVTADFNGNPYPANAAVAAGNGLATGDYTLRVTYGSCVSNPLVIPVADAVTTITAESFRDSPNTVCVADNNAGDTTIPDNFNGDLTVTPDAMFGAVTDFSYQWYLGLSTIVNDAIAGGAPGMGANAPVGATSAAGNGNVLQNAPDGDYTVVLTGITGGHAYEGCTITLDGNIAPNKIDPVINTVGGAADVIIRDETTCVGGAAYPNGGIDLLDVMGTGASTFSYAWYSGPSVDTDSLIDQVAPPNIINFKTGTADGLNVTFASGGATINNLVAGQYTVVATQTETGCVSNVVTQTVDRSSAVITATEDVNNTFNNPVCTVEVAPFTDPTLPDAYGGQIRIMPGRSTPFTAPFTYAWYVGSSPVTVLDITSVPGVVFTNDITQSIVSNIPGGTYTLVIGDDTGCTSQYQFSIIDQEPTPVVVNNAGGRDVTVVDESTCAGSGLYPNGSITLNNVTGLNIGTIPSVTTTNFSYTWHSGQNVDTDSLIDKVTPPNIVDFKTGGTGAAGLDVVFAAGGSMISNLVAGKYTVVATQDETGCPANPVTITVGSTNPVITADVDPVNTFDNLVCNVDIPASDPNIPDTFGGQIGITPGGVAPFTYTWYVGGTTTTLLDNTSVPGVAINSDNTESIISNLPGGIYTLIIGDDTGCTEQFSFSIIDLEIDPVITVAGGNTVDFNMTPNSHCEGSDSYPNGSIDLLNVGTGTLVFEWYHGTTVNAANLLTDGTTIFALKSETIPSLPPSGTIPPVTNATTKFISNLNAGSYTVRSINTSTGCVSEEEIVIVTSPPPNPLVVTAIVVQDDFAFDVLNPTGQLSASATTGTTGTTYTINWYSGGLPAGPFVVPSSIGVAEGAVVMTPIVPAGLNAGTYTVEIIDERTNCSSTEILNINRSVPTLSANVVQTSPQRMCNPPDGEAIATPTFLPSNGAITGFVPDYEYDWYIGQTVGVAPDFATGTGVSDTITALAAGFYTVVVRELTSGVSSNPEKVEIQDLVTALEPTIVFGVPTSATSCDNASGSVSVTVTIPSANTFDIVWYEGSQDYANDTTLFASNLSDGSVLSGQAGKVSFGAGTLSGGTFTVGGNIEGVTSAATGIIASIDLFVPTTDQSDGATISLVPGSLMGAFTDTETVSVDGLGVINAASITFTPPASATITPTPSVPGVVAMSALSTVSSGLFTVVAVDRMTGCRYQEVIGIPFVGQQTTTTLDITHVEQCPDDGTATVGIQDSGTPGYMADSLDDITQYQIYLYVGNGVPSDPFTPYEFPVGSGIFYPIIKDGSTESDNPGLSGVGLVGSNVTFTGLPAGAYTALAREKPITSFLSTSRCFSAAATDEIEQRAYVPIVNSTTKVDNSACAVDATPYNFDGNGSIEVNALKDVFDTAQPGDFRFEWFDGNGVQITESSLDITGSILNIDTEVTVSTLSNLDPGTYTIEVRRLGQPLPTISYIGTGGFLIGEIITINGLVTAQVDADDTGADILTISSLNGTIANGEAIAAPSGATATVNTFTPGGGTPIEQAVGCVITTQSFIIQNIPDIHTITMETITPMDNCSPDFSGVIEIIQTTVNGTVIPADLTGYTFTWAQVSLTDPSVTFDVNINGAFTNTLNGTTNRVADLPAGEYDVFGVFEGCQTATRRYMIVDQSFDPGISLMVLGGNEDTSCEVNQDVGNGQIDFTITNNNPGFAADFSYTWYRRDSTVRTMVVGAGIAGITGTPTIAAGGTFNGTLTGIDGGSDYTIEIINVNPVSPDRNCAITATIPLDEMQPVIFIDAADRTVRNNNDCSPFDGQIEITDLTVNNASLGNDLTGYTFVWIANATTGASLTGTSTSDTNNGTDNLIDGLRAGTYNVMIDNGNDCTEIFDIVVDDDSESPDIVFSVDMSDDFCASGEVGQTPGSGEISAAVRLSNGTLVTTGYNFVWTRTDDTSTLMNGVGTVIVFAGGTTLTGLSDGNYTLTVTDDDGTDGSLNCSSTSAIDLDQAPVVIDLVETGADVDVVIVENNDCSPAFDGSISVNDLHLNETQLSDLTPALDLTGYTFAWTAVSVIDPTIPPFDIVTDAIISSTNNGTHNVISGLPGGVYRVSITRAGCPVFGPFEFTVPNTSNNPEIVLTEVLEDQVCGAGGVAGSGELTASVRLSDGSTTTTGYSFSWFRSTDLLTQLTTGGTIVVSADRATISGLSDDNYTVVVLDTDNAESFNCSSTAAIDVVQDPVDLSIVDTDYTTDISTHCTDAITLADGTLVTFVEQNGAIRINMIRENGLAPIDVNPDYQFDWTLTDGTALPAVLASGATVGRVHSINATRDSIDQLPAGTYSVTITNTACGVSISTDITVTDQTTDPTLAFVVTPNTNCGAVFNGTLQVTATTGVEVFSAGRYQVEWFDGINSTFPPLIGNVGAEDGSSTNDNINHINQLDTKDYTVRVTDRMTGCAVEATRFVNEVIENSQLSVPQINIIADRSCDVVDPTIVNPFKGSVVINDNDITLNSVRQAVALYTFEWYSDQNRTMQLKNIGAAGIQFVPIATPGTPITSNSINNLEVGTYYVVATKMVTDCPTSQVTINIPGSKTGPVLNFAATPNSVCTPLNAGEGNGTLLVTATDLNDPTPTFTYVWTGIGAPEGTTSSLSNRDDASYEVTVTNTNTSCFTTKFFEIPENEIDLRVDIVDLVHITTCNDGGSASIPAGGIFYDFDNDGVSDNSDPGNYLVEWFDDPLAAALGNDTIFNSTGAGNYFVRVTGMGQFTNNGCPSGFFPFEIFGELADIIRPNIQLTVAATDTDCIVGSGTGQIDMAVTSVASTDMITVNWFNGPNTTGTPIVTDGPTTLGGLNGGTLSQTLLDAGSYTVQVVNATSGCDIDQSIELDDEHVDPVIIDMTVRAQTDCIGGGSAEILALNSGNLGDYTYFWFDDLRQLTAPDFNPIQSGAGTTFGPLSAGTYFVIAEENSTQCRTSLPAQIDVIDSSFLLSPIAITQTSVTLQTNCDPTLANGSISVAANGIADILQFTYTWRDENGVVIEANNPSVGGLAAGAYTVDITSLSTGCSNQRIFTMIDDNETLLLRTSVSANTHCDNTQFNVGPNGRVAATIINGSSIYDFFWFSGTAVPNSFASFATDPNLVGNGQFLDSLASGTYTVIAVDQMDNFCVTAPRTVVVPDESKEPPLTITQVAPLTNCDLLRPNGEARVDSPGNNLAVYHIEWYVGTDTNVQPFQSGFGVTEADSLSAITYTVVLIDIVQGCQSTVEITIEDAPAPVLVPELSEEIVHRIDCVEPNGEAEVTIAGGPENFRLEWFLENDLITPFFVGTKRTDLDASVYIVVAEDLTTGCRSVGLAFEILDESRAPVFTVTTTPSVCSLDNGGASLSFDQIVNIDSIVWDLGNGDLRYDFQLANVTDDTGYRVFVRDGNQCEFEATFNITTDIIVYNGVSDNADGMNDWFIIDCIDRFENPSVKVFNRAGQLVWETDTENGYINGDDTHSFRGIANKGVSFGSDRLPEGTYFYIIDRNRLQGQDDIVQGFLELVR